MVKRGNGSLINEVSMKTLSLSRPETKQVQSVTYKEQSYYDEQESQHFLHQRICQRSGCLSGRGFSLHHQVQAGSAANYPPAQCRSKKKKKKVEFDFYYTIRLHGVLLKRRCLVWWITNKVSHRITCKLQKVGKMEKINVMDKFSIVMACHHSYDLIFKN